MKTTIAAAGVLAALSLTGCATNSNAPQGDPARITAAPNDAPTAKVGQIQALGAAQSYVDMVFMSEKGLRKQLRFDKHEPADIDYAMSHVKADWGKEADEAARGYMDSMPMSRDGLAEQLRFDGFTDAQVKRGVATAWGDR